MGLFEGLLGGFLDRKYAVEAENRRQAEQSSAAERQVFQSLLNSPDDETRNLALAGLLDSANPRRKAKGLRGWIGETQASPYLEQIRNLSPMVGVQEEVSRPTLPSRQMASGQPLAGVQPAITEVPDQEIGDPAVSMAQPASSPVQPGAPPPTPVSYTQSPPTPATFTRLAFRPRQVVASPEQAQFSKAIGEARAEVEADKMRVAAGLPPRYGSSYLRGQATQEQSIAGEVPDGKGGWVPAFGVFNRVRGTYEHPGTDVSIEGFRPRTTTASASMGVQIEPLALAMYGKKGAALSQVEMANVLEASKLQKGQLTPKDAISAAQRFLPNATIEQQMGLADALLSGTQAPIATGVGGGPPAPTAASGTPPSASTAPSTPSPAQAPAGGPPKLSSIVPPEVAGGSKETGKPLPPAVAQSLAKAKSTNDLIDQALAALAPYKDDSTLEGALKMAQGYRLGSADDPIANAAAQLSDLAGLQNSAQSSLTGGGTRAFQFYIDRRQHVPRLPSGRQILAYQNTPFGADTILKGSLMLRGDEGGFDSPKLMYDKLLQAKKNNESFVKELETETAVTKPMASHGPTTAGPKTRDTAKPGEAYFDPATKSWMIRQ